MYLILLLLVGIPLLYMIIEQWLRMDNIRAWKQLAPWLSGLGYSSTLVGWGWQTHKFLVPCLLQVAPSGPPCPPQACVLVSLHNSTLISWNLLYLGQSFDYPPPREHCQMHSHDHGNISMTSKERDREMDSL